MHNGEHTPLNDAYNYSYRNSMFNLYAGQINGDDDVNNLWGDRRTVCSADILRDTIEYHIDYLILDSINRLELDKHYPNINISSLNSKVIKIRHDCGYMSAINTIVNQYRTSNMYEIEKTAYNLTNGESFLECVEVAMANKVFLSLMEEGLSSQDATNVTNTFKAILHPGLVTLFNNAISIYNPIVTGYVINLEGGK
jgi:hypothetical protein